MVEDNPANRELLRDWLEVEGYEVWVAEDLKSSYDALGQGLPEAILLDINLGSDNGLDLVTHLHRHASTKDIPVIAVTAHALATEQEPVLKMGCNACLSKPIDFDLLRNELHRWLR